MTGRASPSSSIGTTMPGSTTRSGTDRRGREMTSDMVPRFLSLMSSTSRWCRLFPAPRPLSANVTGLALVRDLLGLGLGLHRHGRRLDCLEDHPALPVPVAVGARVV